MYSFMRSALLVAVGVIVAIGVTTLPSRAGDESKDLQSRIDKLEKKVTTLQAKLKYVSVEMDPINGLAGPHVIFEGCNVHVRSGSGSTNDAKAAPLGLGNLIVGYNEEPITAGPGRGGSHNLIVGPYHQYSSLAGVVFGSANTVSGFADTVTGGTENEASEDYTNVSGGARNIASGYASSVSGGDTNEASGPYSSVAGGGSNMASAYYSCVSGGYGNLVTNYYSSVSGGYTNTASGEFSSVSGGGIRGAPGSEDWVAGGLLQDN